MPGRIVISRQDLEWLVPGRIANIVLLLMAGYVLHYVVQHPETISAYFDFLGQVCRGLVNMVSQWSSPTPAS